jgi:hypothetical protein
MKRSMGTAFISGVVLLVAAHIGWAVLMSHDTFNPALDWLLRLLPIAAAFAAASLAPKDKLLAGMSMVLVGTMLTLITNYLLQWQGVRVDFPGARGLMALLLPTVLTYLVLCGAGTAVGVWISKKRQ